MKNIAILPVSLICILLSFLTSLKVFSQSTPQTFTSSGSFTVPAGVTQVTVQAWGGGGSGSNTTLWNPRGGGGGGGAFASGTVNVTPGHTYNVVVGVGGANADGGASTFNGTSIKAAGGSNGQNSNGGAGGTIANSIGSIRHKGGNGAKGDSNSGGGGGGAGSTGDGHNATNSTGGAARTQNGGSGGNGVSASILGGNNGRSGSSYGAGGSGAATFMTNHSGGSGANGAVIISWTIPEIDVTGNNLSIIGNATNTPVLTNNTHFGTAQIVSQTLTKTFIIKSLGTGPLTIGTISLTNAKFTLVSFPASGTNIPVNETAAVVVSFNSATVGDEISLLTIASNDADEASYRINLSAESKKIFFDSDNDGVYDDVDIDKDNDGISDVDEEQACRKSGGASVTNYKFLNETFGAGTTRTTINTTYNAETTYCYEDGTGSCGTGVIHLDDGKYTVYHKAGNGDGIDQTPINEVAHWADELWYTGGDHTGDTNGRMAMFNASYDKGVFYTAKIVGALPNIPITYSFWVLNLDTETAPNIASRLRPNIKVEFRDVNNTVLETILTGDIPPSINGNPAGSWHNFTADLEFDVTEFYVYFINNEIGGLGNDLAIDDIVITQTLCDTDGDGIADIFDLDSDNDGIPDVVEANPTAAKLSLGRGHLTGEGWIDTNNNGMHDDLEHIRAIDTDGDGVPDYLDLDSDNDGLFDVDESGAINSNYPAFQNGDGDITGNGVGDGLETEVFREKDSDGDDTIEKYGDGILDIFDIPQADPTFANSYGNSGQGMGPYYTLDSDGDGIPDYRDPKNDLTGVLDIETSEIYAGLPHDENGVLLSKIDLDGDGIMASRDGDDTVFGSPRNLDSSYSLYFDGRNDYVEDNNVIASGSATLMAFIKSDGANTNGNNRIIAGQSDFNILVNSATNKITAVSESVTLTSTTTISHGIWTHVALTTQAGGDIVLFINGVEEARNMSSAGGITSNSKFMIGSSTTPNNYFKGEIDEVRVFNKALTTDELKRMVYQELDDAHGFNRGKIIPSNISPALGTHLIKYYKMDAFRNDILDDKKTPDIDVSGAKMYNFKHIYFQRAPLPYLTSNDGDWTNSATWVNGTEWDIMSKKDKINEASIIHIKHNIDLNGTYNTQGTVGLIVDAEKKLSVTANKGLYNSWYLKLDGLIDLDNESQLIQTETSVLDVTSSGKLERDQQGTKDYFTYNYWSSPVGVSNTTSNNNSYSVPNVLRDGSVPASPINITFSTSGYNGSPGIPGSKGITIADYWLWKYSNRLGNTYAEWQHLRSSGTLSAGEGFTMKGVENTAGAITLQQNYVFTGKPNNGDISLTLSPGNDYLVGNPYPSAIDANEFILDNIKDGSGRAEKNIINGALYFWDHFASGSHNLGEYQGGYATYTLMGATVAISNDSRINATGVVGTKKPERYIPVSQGFFVSSILDASLIHDVELTSPVLGGDITFKNSQRVFKTEASGASLFIKPSKDKFKNVTTKDTEVDDRQKIRLLFDSPKGYHRQLLAGVDENTSNGFDIGYDAPLTEVNNEDMFWIFDTNNFIIQAVNNFDDEQILPLGIKTAKAGISKIKIDDLENITNDLNIYLNDKALGIQHNLKESAYEVYLTTGSYLNRFEITFKNSDSKTLSTPDMENENIQAYFSNEKESIVIHNPTLKQLKSVEIINLLGQSINTFNENTAENYLEYKTNQISTGVYLIKIQTETGSYSKKIVIK